LDIYYTFDNTDPDQYSHEYESPLSVPKNATWLKVISYDNDVPVGKIITLGLDELENRVKK